MRLAPPLAVLLLCAALVSGCGGSDGSSETGGTGPSPQAQGSSAPAGSEVRSCETLSEDTEDLRATNLPCKKARVLMSSWQRSKKCSPPSGASRSSCKLMGAYRCLSANAGRGLSVSCARPGHSVAFIIRRK